VAKRFYLDASVLAKRYVAETGTPVVNYLFTQAAREDMMCLALGTVEVLSIFVRKKNANAISLAVFNQAMTDFRSEVIDAPDFTKVSLPDPLLYAAMPLVETHSINATDAVILRSALDLAAQLRADGNDLALVASDHRLLRAAQAEGLLTFDPETQTETDLDALLT
jgi:predicted nucleic acid-binding protein